jgi:hypothetical protein
VGALETKQSLCRTRKTHWLIRGVGCSSGSTSQACRKLKLLGALSTSNVQIIDSQRTLLWSSPKRQLHHQGSSRNLCQGPILLLELCSGLKQESIWSQCLCDGAQGREEAPSPSWLWLPTQRLERRRSESHLRSNNNVEKLLPLGKRWVSAIHLCSLKNAQIGDSKIRTKGLEILGFI